MIKTKAVPKSIDDYISQAPAKLQPALRKLRKTIKKAAPNSTEKISYRMPAFFQNGALVFFAVFQHHIGFYPITDAMKEFKTELSEYKRGKGSVQFPIDAPLPYNLISRIVKFRLSKNLEKLAGRSRKGFKT